MTTMQDMQALIEQAVRQYPEMLRALLSAMRTHQRNDEPEHSGTAPAVIPLALGCVLAVRLSNEPGALDLAATLLQGAVSMMAGKVPGNMGTEKVSEVLRRLEQGGVI